MQQQRGTCDSTLSNYEVHISRARSDESARSPSRWDARGLREFVLEGSRTCGWAAAKKRTTALRMFLRFLIAEGRCASELHGGGPCAGPSAPVVPAALPVRRRCGARHRLLRSRRRRWASVIARFCCCSRAWDCAPATSCSLRLRDIDWKAAWIHVSGKGRRETRLPLTREVGDALVTYLTRSRPQTDTDTVFVRSRAPFRAFRSHCAVSVIVDRAFARAGVTRPSRGAAHLLRHSVATSMLRHGASLQEVAALLRHRSVTTTEIYAKVDVMALRHDRAAVAGGAVMLAAAVDVVRRGPARRRLHLPIGSAAARELRGVFGGAEPSRMSVRPWPSNGRGSRDRVPQRARRLGSRHSTRALPPGGRPPPRGAAGGVRGREAVPAGAVHPLAGSDSSAGPGGRLARGTGRCGATPTARSLRCSRPPGCACQRPSTSDWTTSRPMAS